MDKKERLNLQELRVGSRLEYFINEDGIEWKATTIDAHDILWAESKPRIFSKMHRGIPLTHAVLEQYGFKSPRQGWDARECPLNKVWIGDYDDTQKRVWIHSNYCGILHLQYLHQLQVLYFALTNTDLNLNAER